MSMKNNGNDSEVKYKYSIDLSWYREQERSFILLATSRLCPSSQKKKIPKTDTAIFNTMKQCCSKSEDFINPELPLAECIFRLFLANGNRPLSLQQIQARLQQSMSDISGSRDLSIPKLQRILDSDRFYGLRIAEIEDEEEPNNNLLQEEPSNNSLQND
ncbi:MAG: hypothetical protein JSW38_04780 [Dehalococcoidia bacterium]|nr:MAG: hypothetical protein JSV02_02170 [Dehalococcoidia bacterium]UCG84134.1 MAG: hypothetical protein JSW38_04780 [Dehalococcoidia bacterium]